MESSWTVLSSCCIDEENSSAHCTHPFIYFFVNEIELICAHFPWNNLYLLLIEKYLLGPILLLKFIPFFMSITNLRFSEFSGKLHLKQMIAKVIEMSVYNLLYHSNSSTPLLFYHFSCPHLFYEKRILQIQVCEWFILQNVWVYSSQRKQRMLAFFKLFNIGSSLA